MEGERRRDSESEPEMRGAGQGCPAEFSEETPPGCPSVQVPIAVCRDRTAAAEGTEEAKRL